MNRRRAMINLGIGSLGMGMIPAVLVGQTDPASAPPQEGDLLVKVGDKTPKSVRPEDIAIGAPPVRVWPMTQASNIVRNENRLNEVLLIRLDPATLNVETRSICADGVLAFSVLCPHAGCTITDWIPSRNVLACDCHSSEFDPREAGKVVDGPAAHPLPPLALKLDNGNLAVARPFAVAIRFDE
jgi:Rieske Fe-S protein